MMRPMRNSTGESTMKIRLLLSMLLLLGVSNTLPAQATAEEPQAVVQSVIEDSIRLLQERREDLARDPAVAQEIVAGTLGPYADVERMSRFVLGRHWRTASPDQRARFVDAFRDYLVFTYGSALREYADEIIEEGRDAQIDYQVQLDDRNPDRAMVHSHVRLSDGRSFDVSYRMLERDGDWKVYDVVVEGLSVLLSYKQNLGAQLAQADVDTLITRLRERTGSADP